MLRSWLNQYGNHLDENKEIHPESTYLAQRMTPKVALREADVIVELRPGTTGCTEEIIRKMRKDATLVLIETDSTVVHFLKERYGSFKRIKIVETDTIHLKEALRMLKIEQVDLIISGFPFARLDAIKTMMLLTEIKTALSDTGMFVTAQYTKLRKPNLEKVFSRVKDQQEFRNVPPAYLFYCMNEGGIV